MWNLALISHCYYFFPALVCGNEFSLYFQASIISVNSAELFPPSVENSIISLINETFWIRFCTQILSLSLIELDDMPSEINLLWLKSSAVTIMTTHYSKNVRIMRMRVLNKFIAAVINTTVEISTSLFIFQWASSVEWTCKVGRGMENLINLRRLRFIVCDDCIDWFWINVWRQKDWMVNQWVNENRLRVVDC